MNLYIKEKPYGYEELETTANVAASGSTWKMLAENLVAAINNDEVDTENCELIIIEE